MAGKALKDITALCKCPACGEIKRMHYLCPTCAAKLRKMMNKHSHGEQQRRETTRHWKMSKQYLTAHTVDNAHRTDIFSLAATTTALLSVSGSSNVAIRTTTEPTYPLVQSLDRAHKLGIHHICTARTGTGNVAATAGFGGDIKIWRRKQDGRDDSWELWWDIAPSKSGGDIWAIAMSADEGYLACTTHDGKIKVWDLNRKEIEQTYETGGGAGGSFGMAVDLSRDGKLTASGHQSGAVYVFNNDAGRLSYSLPGLIKPVRTVAFSPGCKRLAAAGNAGIIALYDMETGEHVGNLAPSTNNNAWITCLDWNDTGSHLLSGSLDGKVRVWDVNQDKSELEIKATILDDRAIQEYWKELESQRKAKRVHQDSLPMSEKILRYFDVSSQYGPCVGLSRLKRWQRAERLGLKPPIEVLAVLLKDDTRKDEASQQAHMDYILNLTAVGSS
ncbi:hypothetical protein P8C59_006378 [Phyllachora maydis]|uniref:Uncharacterized protein n=1 Tax=Phyllachora maydis TaxID=1825666 RepID=A0AAD9I842_9PEZI|nr:hypothetical protein P8C59_006378 [Phyllachora maydis]